MKALRLKFASIFLLFSLNTLISSISAREGYYPESFIQNLNNQSIINQQLKELIRKVTEDLHYPGPNGHDIIAQTCPSKKNCTGHNSKYSYKQARQFLFGTLHLKHDSDGPFVTDLYCQKSYRASDGVGVNKIPNPSKINCEHTWPQSKFSKSATKHTQKVDLHHLFPVSMRANSSRSNHILAEVTGVIVNSDCTSSFKGKAVGTSTSAFEPPMNHKGNAARALLYFSARYSLPIDQTQEYYLRKWHLEDPVDSEERTRNDLVESFQLNRNPFVDYPELVEMIDNF